MLDPNKLDRLFERVLREGNAFPKEVEFAYLFGQTSDNQTSVLDIAPKFECPIGIVGHDDTEASGFPGYSPWKAELLVRGIPNDRIVGIEGSFSDDGHGRFRGNTLTEAAALVRYARKAEVRSVAIVATEWHLVRCLMTTVGVLLKEYPGLKCYPVLGMPLSMDQEVRHSQGVLRAKRSYLFWYERGRLEQYHNQDGIRAAEQLAPSIPTVEAVCTYLDSR